MQNKRLSTLPMISHKGENDLRRWFGIQHDCGMDGNPEEKIGTYRPCWHWFGGWFPERADNFLTTLSLFLIRPRHVLINWWEMGQFKKAIKAGDEDTKMRLTKKAVAQYQETVKRQRAKEQEGR